MTSIRIAKIKRNKERRDNIRISIFLFIISESMLIWGLMTATTLNW